jgi:hypothetical protein
MTSKDAESTKAQKRFTFLTLLVGHLNERYPMPRSVTPFGRGLTLITLGLGQVRDRDDGRHPSILP